MSNFRHSRWLAGSASMIVVMAISATSGACHAASGGPPQGVEPSGLTAFRSGLEGQWVLRELSREDEAPLQPEITLEFVEDRVEGVAACNQYGARVETDSSSFTLGPMRLTRKACPPPAMELEQRYVAALQAAESWRIEEGRLFIDYVDGDTSDRLVFDTRERAARRRTSEAGVAPLVRDVKMDLAQRLGIEVAEIELLSSEEAEWPDAGLGCPEEGMAYAQVITPGYRLLLRAGETEYRYHANRTGGYRFCE